MRPRFTARTRSSRDPRAASWARPAPPRAPASTRSSPSTWAVPPPMSATSPGEFERALDVEVGGVRLRTPILQIHTVAAGGGPIVSFDGVRLRVGPDSAGANPGPASYRRGGPLTVTDCNVLLGRIQPDFFPALFGAQRRSAARYRHRARRSSAPSRTRFPRSDAQETPQLAAGCIRIAVENMANAIKKISVQRGHDVTEYTLTCFGGAAGQHACLVADALGMQRAFIHPLAGVLSAYGIGLADSMAMRQQTIEEPLDDAALARLAAPFAPIEQEARAEIAAQGLPDITKRRARAAAQVRRHGFHAARCRCRTPPRPYAPSSSRSTARAMAFMCRAAPSSSMPSPCSHAGVRDGCRSARAGPSTASGPARRTPCAVPCSTGGWLDAPILRARVAAAGRCDRRARGDLRAPQHHCHGARAGEPCSLPPITWCCEKKRARASRDRLDACRPGVARDLQQSVHGHRRADGRDAGQHRELGEHQGAAGFLLRAVRRAGSAHRQRAAHAGAPGFHGRIRAGNPAPAHGGHAARRRLRAECALRWRHASARCHGGDAGVSRAGGQPRVLRGRARTPCRHRRHHAGLHAVRLEEHR